MEYFPLYGWAILIIIIIIVIGIVLWQLGGPYQTNPVNKAKGLGSSEIGVIDKSILCSDGNVTMIIINKAGINLSDITVKCTTGCETKEGKIYSDEYDGTETTTIPAGGKAYLRLESIHDVAGDAVNIEVTIDFTERIAGKYINRTQSGQIFCTME